MIRNFSKTKLGFNESNRDLKIAIVKALYHEKLTGSMEQKCRESLIESGVAEIGIKTFEVPGSWEIPLMVKNLAQSGKFNGIAVFGVIVKGETYHFEMIAGECGRALMEISLEFNIPVALEVLAVYKLEQAEKRTAGKYNKGIEAADTLLKTIRELKKI